MLSIKANIPLGKTIAVLRSGSYCGILFCRHIGGRLLVAGIGTGPVAWERCLRADRKKRGGTCHCLRRAPMSRCYGSVGITPCFKKYSRHENKLSGISHGFVSDVDTFSFIAE